MKKLFCNKNTALARIFCVIMAMTLVLAAAGFTGAVVAEESVAIEILIDVEVLLPDGELKPLSDVEIAIYSEHSRITTILTNDSGFAHHIDTIPGDYFLYFVHADGYQFLRVEIYDIFFNLIESFEPHFHTGELDPVGGSVFYISIFVVPDDGNSSAYTPTPTDITVTLNGRTLEFDVPPAIINDRTMVPFRAIFETFGMNVEWDDDTRTAIGYIGDFRIELPIDSYTAYVDGHPTALDSPATIIDGRTLVPLRFIADSIGVSVNWCGDTRTVIINA